MQRKQLQSNPPRRQSRRGANPGQKVKKIAQNSVRNGKRGNGEYRISRRELWFSIKINGEDTGSRAFTERNYPPWFGSISNLYENYEMHTVRIVPVTRYSSFASGGINLSYNSNPHEQGSTDPTSMAAQQGATQSKIYENKPVTIPRSAWLQQPSRRPCRGSGSWLFEFLWNITASQAGTVDIFIEYDVTFRVPQYLVGPAIFAATGIEGTQTIFSSSETTTKEKTIETVGPIKGGAKATANINLKGTGMEADTTSAIEIVFGTAEKIADYFKDTIPGAEIVSGLSRIILALNKSAVDQVIPKVVNELTDTVKALFSYNGEEAAVQAKDTAQGTVFDAGEASEGITAEFKVPNDSTHYGVRIPGTIKGTVMFGA